MVETLANALQQARSPGSDGLGARIALLHEEVESLSREVHELRSAQEFDRKLLTREGEARHPSAVER